jgi:hypothetical protein
MLTQLRIPKKNQDIIGKNDMFCIFITNDEKRMYTLDPLSMHGKLDIWLYKNLELNKRDYLNILANRVGVRVSNKHTKYELITLVEKWIIFD